MAQFANNKKYGERMNAFWIEPVKKDVMGYALKNVLAGEKVQQGQPLYCVDNAGKKEAYVCKYIEVIAVGNDHKTLTVKKGSLAKVSETYFLSGADSRVLRTISSVTIGDLTDTIVLSAAAAEIEEGAVLVEGVTSGSGSSATVQPKYLPNRIASQKAEVDSLDATVPAMHSGIVIKNVVNYPEEYINSNSYPGTETLIGCPLIMLIIQ